MATLSSKKKNNSVENFNRKFYFSRNYNAINAKNKLNCKKLINYQKYYIDFRYT